MNYVGVRAGGGKTRAFATIASKQSRRDRNTLIIAPTVLLLNEIRATIEAKGSKRPIRIFHSDDGSEASVTARVLAYLDKGWAPGDILLITQQCFLNLPFFANKSKWKLLIDEEIPVFVQHTLNLHDNHALITDHVGLGEAGSVHARVNVLDRTSLKRIVDNKNDDDVWRSLWPMCSMLLRDDCDCYVKIKQLNDLKYGLKAKGQLTIYAFRRPDRFHGFEGVTFASAWFEDSLTFHHWQEHGVEWRVDDDVARSILRPVHPHNPRLTIIYGYEGRNSKALRNRLERDGNGEFREKATALMGADPFLWLKNNDRRDSSVLRGCENGVPLPPVSAGLNAYSSYRHAIIPYATNYDPGAADVLERVAGFDGGKQARAMVGNLYQAFMRTALRNDEIEDEAQWVVACRDEAELLSERFPGSVVKALGLTPIEKRKVGRPRKYKNDNDRKRDHERKERELSSLRVDFAQVLAPTVIEKVVFLNKGDESTYITKGDFVRYFRGSYFNNMRDNKPQIVNMSENDLVRLLANMSSNVYEQKDDIPAITGALFDPSVNEGGIRDAKTVLLTRGLWLDFEGGDLRPDHFEQAFPHIPFVAYSTFHHTKQDPRFRIYVPTNRPMNVEESIAIYHEIRYSIKTQGWRQGQRAKSKLGASLNDRFDGIDNRSGPSQLSLLPCQSQDRRASFFIDKTENKEPLNVDAWLKQKHWLSGDDEFYGLSVPPIETENLELTPEQVIIINEATLLWETHGRLRGNGNSGIFVLYLSLRRARLPKNEISNRLYHAASQATSKKERKDQVRRLLRDLR